MSPQLKSSIPAKPLKRGFSSFEPTILDGRLDDRVRKIIERTKGSLAVNQRNHLPTPNRYCPMRQPSNATAAGSILSPRAYEYPRP